MGINRDPSLGLLYPTADGWNITHVTVMSFVGLTSFTTLASLNPHPNVSTLYSPHKTQQGVPLSLYFVSTKATLFVQGLARLLY